MAKRKRYSKSTKIQPAVETLTFDLGNVGLATADPGAIPGHRTYYIDLSQVASLANRRFYRQGLNWAVASMKFNSTVVVPSTTQPAPGQSPEGAIWVQKLPNTWIMSNAWEKGFRAWTRMIKEATIEAPSVRPKFLDFKVFMDANHHDEGVSANLLPAVSGSPVSIGSFTPATRGEWDYSTYEIPVSNADPTLPAGNSVTRDVVAIGGNYTAVGASGNYAVSLIDGYSSSRALPDIEDPNLPDDASSAAGSLAQNWLVALFNEGTSQDSEVLQDLETQNNIAPYPFENDGTNVDTMYPGGPNQLNGLQLVALENITGTTVGGITYVKGSSFPCGLIRIDVQNNNQALELNNILQIDLVPGSHRGYLCEPMTEM